MIPPPSPTPRTPEPPNIAAREAANRCPDNVSNSTNCVNAIRHPARAAARWAAAATGAPPAKNISATNSATSTNAIHRHVT